MKNGCCTENVQQPFLWIIQLSHPTRSGRVRVSSEQWGLVVPWAAIDARSISRTMSLMARQSSGRSVWLRPEWVNRILPRWPTTSVRGKIWGADLS